MFKIVLGVGGFVLVVAVLAVIAGALLLHEAITWNQLLGGAVVILGAAVSQGRLDKILPARLR